MNRRLGKLGLAAAVLALGLEQCAAPPQGGPPAARGTGRVFGKLSLEGGRPLPGDAVVRAAGREVRPDAAGNYAFDSLPGGKYAVVAEVRTGPNRYLGLPFVIVDEKQPLRLDIVLGDATDLDRFCSDCHPFFGKQTRGDQIVRDMHVSGVKPRKAKRTTQLLDPQGSVTCESCHSLHQPTGVERFVRYPFRNGDLCNRCH